MALAGHDVSPDIINAIREGGVPDGDFHAIIVAAKYAAAHKGILLPREVSNSVGLLVVKGVTWILDLGLHVPARLSETNVTFLAFVGF